MREIVVRKKGMMTKGKLRFALIMAATTVLALASLCAPLSAFPELFHRQSFKK